MPNMNQYSTTETEDVPCQVLTQRSTFKTNNILLLV